MPTIEYRLDTGGMEVSWSDYNFEAIDEWTTWCGSEFSFVYDVPSIFSYSYISPDTPQSGISIECNDRSQPLE